MTIPTESELAQAYSQGYQDGRRGLEDCRNYCIPVRLSDQEMIAELAVALRGMVHLYQHYDQSANGSAIVESARTALAKVAQPQPATKGE